MSIRPMRSLAPYLLLVSALVGCGGAKSEKPAKLAPVNGMVTLDGKPLAMAAMTFLPDGETKGIAGVAYTGEDGKFEAKWRTETGIPPGSYKVVVSRLGLPNGSPVPPGQSAADVGAIETVPPRFSDAAQTKLALTVPDTGLTQTFDLKSK